MYKIPNCVIMFEIIPYYLHYLRNVMNNYDEMNKRLHDIGNCISARAESTEQNIWYIH